jgi:hypothetical protein
MDKPLIPLISIGNIGKNEPETRHSYWRKKNRSLIFGEPLGPFCSDEAVNFLRTREGFAS